MSFRLEGNSGAAALHGQEGDLIFVRVKVDPRLLEELLEALAGADFPINPEIRHAHQETTVEFPAYDTQIAEIQRLVQSAGIQEAGLEIANMLRAIA